MLSQLFFQSRRGHNKEQRSVFFLENIADLLFAGDNVARKNLGKADKPLLPVNPFLSLLPVNLFDFVSPSTYKTSFFGA